MQFVECFDGGNILLESDLKIAETTQKTDVNGFCHNGWGAVVPLWSRKRASRIHRYHLRHITPNIFFNL